MKRRKNHLRAEAIDWVNDPARFGLPLEKRVDRLESRGTAKRRPWADTYWPTYQDGVNHRWQDTGVFENDLSPAEKYDAAFNGWDPKSVKGLRPFRAEYGGFDKPFDAEYYRKLGPFAKYCSTFAGNKKTRDAAAKGQLKADGTAKSGNDEDDFGGIATWWGLCHAWAPASIRELEPVHACEHNGIRFEVSDIKALLIACYDQSNSTLIGGRNEERPKEVRVDSRGRPKKNDMRDINPGTFHVLLGNVLGRDGVSFCEDRTAHYEVWNQPIAEYRVKQLKEIDQAQAARLVRDTDATYDYNSKAKRFFHVKLEVDYITESPASTVPNSGSDAQERTDPYQYVLEADADGKVIGGEWLTTSRTDHPDFLWYPYKDGGVPLAPQISLEQVRVLLEKSRTAAAPTRGVKVEAFARLKEGETKKLEPISVLQDGNLEFILAGNGDIDVYAKIGGGPELNLENGQPLEVDLVMYEPGSNERKTLKVRAGDVVHVVMRGYDDNSDATLRINQI
jgi:hypothetical protein